MIPKIIHYIWFGGKPLTPLAEQCLASWKEHMPEWELKRWDEINFDIASAPLYVRQAYEARKFAFVSDYVRLWALEQYGGVYVDTDVKVLKSYEPLLNDTAFIGMEESLAHMPGTCVMGCEPHCKWVRDMLALYDGISFARPDGSLDLTTNVERLGQRMKSEGMNELKSERDKPWKRVQYIKEWGLKVYTHDYFSPITSTRVMRKTKNTYSIHYFAESWRDGKRKRGWRDWTITHEIINALVQIKRFVERLLKSDKLREFIRFALVGTFSTGLHYGIYLLLVWFAGAYKDNTICTNIAYSIGYVISWFCNFYLTAHFTFKSETSVKRGVGFALSHGINYGLHILFLNLFLWLGLSETWAPIPVFCIVIPINFILVRYVFRSKYFEK